METASAVSETAAPKRARKGNGTAARAPEMSRETAEATKTAAVETPGEAPEPASLNVLTSVLGLMMASPRHRHLFLADLEWALLPPLALKQFRLFTKDGRPVAFATWAFVSEEAAERLEAGHGKLKPGEWKSGDRCWIVDLVAPPGAATEFLAILKESALKGHQVSVPALDPKTGERQVNTLDETR